MNHSILTEKHYSLTIEKDVETIYEPLKQYGINYFASTRIFNDGTMPLLTNIWQGFYNQYINQYDFSPPPSKEFLKKKFYYIPLVENISVGFQQGFYDYLNLFNTSHPIYFFEMGHGYMDLFAYGSTPNNSGIINFYLNNIEVLENFKYYFKEKAHKLIEKSNKNRIILPEKMRPKISGIDTKNTPKPFKIKRYTIPTKTGETQITNRELEAIRCFTKGYTAKEAAVVLNISPRTIEYYFNNIKTKLGLAKKSSIISKLTDLDLL